MTNFMLISIVVTTLFVMTVLVVDHIEVNRHVRMTQFALIQEIEEAFQASQHRYYEDGIGYTNASYEEMVAAKQNQETITKILKTM